MPRVSVIVPCRNAGPRIGPCLESVVHQDHRDVEIIVVDDDSTDDSIARARHVLASSKRPHTFVDGGGLGVSHARNVGLDRSSGTYVQWLDADDELAEPSKLSQQLTALERVGDNAVAYTDYAWLRVEGPSPQFGPVAASISADPLLAFLLGRVPQLATFLYPRSIADVLRARGLFTEGVSFAEDREYATVAAMTGARFVHVPMVGVVYFQWSAAQLSRAADAERVSAVRMMFERLRAHASAIRADIQPHHVRFLAQDTRQHRWARHVTKDDSWSDPAVVTEGGERIGLDPIEAALVRRFGVSESRATLEFMTLQACEVCVELGYDLERVRDALDRLVEKRLLVPLST